MTVNEHLAAALYAAVPVAEVVRVCLSFDAAVSGPACEQWARLPEPRQRDILNFADRAGVTLHLWSNARMHGLGGALAQADEYRERRRKNEVRLEARRRTAAELTGWFAQAGLRCAMLKGFLMEPDFIPSAADRLQNDIDFLFSPADARAAFELLQRQGYHQLVDEPDGAMVHLPMLLPPDFIHRGNDFFNPETQPAVEVHDNLWVAEFERIPVTFHPDPLSRIVERNGLPGLHPHDQLAACTLHVIRHTFRGSLRASHLYEIAGFLDNHVDDDAFWKSWIAGVNAPLRSLCTCGFALAARVFHSRWPAALAAERNALPTRVCRWIDRYGPVVLDRDRSAKEQLFLQLPFVHGFGNKMVVLQRRLAPMRIPSGAAGPGGKRFLLRRAWFHFTAFFKFLRLAVGQWL
jgi:hypothetical protein